MGEIQNSYTFKPGNLKGRDLFVNRKPIKNENMGVMLKNGFFQLQIRSAANFCDLHDCACIKIWKYLEKQRPSTFQGNPCNRLGQKLEEYCFLSCSVVEI
jgi:hypothetical protein